MFLRLLLLFTLVPLVELYVLIRLGGLLGAGPTILLVLATGIAGAWLARREGFRSWIAVQAELAAGRLPGVELLHALVVVIAGVLLVTPGVFTDLFGILLLIRPVRTAMIGRVRNRIASRLRTGDVQVFIHEGSDGPREWAGRPPDDGSERSRGRVIDI